MSYFRRHHNNRIRAKTDFNHYTFNNFALYLFLFQRMFYLFKQILYLIVCEVLSATRTQDFLQVFKCLWHKVFIEVFDKSFLQRRDKETLPHPFRRRRKHLFIKDFPGHGILLELSIFFVLFRDGTLPFVLHLFHYTWSLLLTSHRQDNQQSHQLWQFPNFVLVLTLIKQ